MLGITLHGRTLVNQTAAWLALISVAMLFIAPVISKSIKHRTACQHVSHSMPMAMSGMHHDMAAPAHCEVMSPMSHSTMSGQAMSPMEEIACGYCQLLVHLPFVQFALAFLLWLLLLFVVCLSPLPLRCAIIFKTWSSQHARAPPTALQSVF